MLAYAQWSPSASAADDLGTAIAATDWVAASSVQIARLEQQRSTWFRVDVSMVPPSTTWHLVVDSFRPDKVIFYAPTRERSWASQTAGNYVAHAQWPLQTRAPTFLLDLEPGHYSIYMRVTGSPRIFLDSSEIRQAATSQTQASIEALLYGAVFGMCGLVMVSQLLLWAYFKSETGISQLLYTLTLLMAALYGGGFAQWVLDFSRPWPVLLFGLVACSLSYFFARFNTQWLGLKKLSPMADKLHQWFSLAATTMAVAAVVWGGLDMGIALTRVLFVSNMAMCLVLAAWLAHRRWPGALSYLLVFGIIDVAGLARIFRNMGVIPAEYSPELLMMCALTVHLILVTLLLSYQQVVLRRVVELERRHRQEQEDFADMVSHEFRTPLAIISTSAQMMAAGVDGPREKLLQRVDNIRGATKRLSTLLDDYLSIGRLKSVHDTLRLRRCDFYEVLEEATSDWPLERIQITGQPCPSAWVCDPSLMSIVLRNLLANADRHAPHGSVIVLRIGGDLPTRMDIEVIDQGDGIADDEISKIFSKYFRGRAARSQPGAGLGLYLVKKIVTAHQGLIRAHSVPGQGTTFRLSLPALPLP